jgi:hypothetical protein
MRRRTVDVLPGRPKRELIAGRHAEYYRDLFECAEGEAVVRLAREWLADYAREIDNLRSAFDLFTGRWRCCGGHRADGRRSTLWVNLSLNEERRYRIERALTAHTLLQARTPASR